MLDSQIFQKLTNHAKNSLEESNEIAHYCNAKQIKPEHLFWAIFLETGSLGSNILQDMEISGDDFLFLHPKKESSKKPAGTQLNFSRETKNAITKAYSIAKDMKYPYVGTEHIVYAIIEKPNRVIEKILIDKKSKTSVKKNTKSKKEASELDEKSIKTIAGNKDLLDGLSKIFNIPGMGFSPNNPLSKEGRGSALKHFCINLNTYAKKNPEPVIGREKEIERMIDTLGRKTKNNPLLIGSPGVGKTAIVNGLAQKINNGEVPYNLSNKKILSLDITLVVAGTSFRGEFEQRLKDIMREAKEDKNVILFIDEIHSIVGAGNVNGGLDAANILKPALSKGEIQCIGATTIDEYKKYIEKDPALERRFQSVDVSEPSEDDAKKILMGIRESFEKFHNVKITEEVIKQTIKLSQRFIQDRFLPDKAIDILDETLSRIKSKKSPTKFLDQIKSSEKKLHEITQEKNRMVSDENYDYALSLQSEEEKILKKIKDLTVAQKKLEKNTKLSISYEDIAQTVSQITKIPTNKIISQEEQNLKDLSKDLSKTVIGQDSAVKQLTSSILRSHIGISNPDKPIGSFLFLGPTGVGKTLIAKTLAEKFFGDPKSLIRIDMSEFMERHNISQLIGAPAGYIGYGEGGKLTEKVKRNPYSVVLFDEVEKAHPDIFNILLQILEEGFLTDAEGKKINFKNTVIILTSNLGTKEFTQASQIGFSTKSNSQPEQNFDEIKNRVLSDLKNKLKPEILNRLDHIIVFNSLQEKDIQTITELELRKLKDRLSEKNLELNFSNSVVDFITKQSISVEQGARLVRKNIQEFIENIITDHIMKSASRPESISLSVLKNKIVIKK